MSPNVIKSLDINNKLALFEFIKTWIENKNIKYEDWMKLRLVPLPKKGNLHDLNNLIGMNLLDIVSKVFIFMLNARSQKLLKKKGHTMKFDATPKVGCAEAVF